MAHARRLASRRDVGAARVCSRLHIASSGTTVAAFDDGIPADSLATGD